MNWKTDKNKTLIKAILSLKNENEVSNFLRDLMTENEIDEFATRLKTAEMLFEQIPYSQIQKETGFSSTTVARVSKWLNNGEGGYVSIINKLHHHNPTKLGKGLSLTRI